MSKKQEFLAEREAAIRESHAAADVGAIMRPYNYPKGKHKVMIVDVQADEMTEGGIIIPGTAMDIKTGECVVIDCGINPPEDLGLEIGQRVQVAKYMGSVVELREKWEDDQGNEQMVVRSYTTLDAAHILNTFDSME